MTADVMLSRAPGVIFVQALSERGVEFVDEYTAIDYIVHDSGYISIPPEGEFALVARAHEQGLEIL